MVEYIVEIEDPIPTGGLQGMDRMLITIQGNETSIDNLLYNLEDKQGYKILKCKNTACKSMLKTKEQMERGLK